jgi:hypothetical protein
MLSNNNVEVDMSYRPRSGESEFGGVGGLIQPDQKDHPTDVQEMWGLYATNSASPDAVDLDRVGVPEAYQESSS